MWVGDFFEGMLGRIHHVHGHFQVGELGYGRRAFFKSR
jgi:hypothetical protein